MSVKFVLPDGECRRFQLDTGSDAFAHMVQRALCLLGQKPTGGPPPVLTYVDDEEDQVSITSTSELMEAFAVARSVGASCLRVTVHSNGAAPAAATVAAKSVADATTTAADSPAAPTKLHALSISIPATMDDERVPRLDTPPASPCGEQTTAAWSCEAEGLQPARTGHEEEGTDTASGGVADAKSCEDACSAPCARTDAWSSCSVASATTVQSIEPGEVSAFAPDAGSVRAFDVDDSGDEAAEPKAWVSTITAAELAETAQQRRRADLRRLARAAGVPMAAIEAAATAAATAREFGSLATGGPTETVPATDGTSTAQSDALARRAALRGAVARIKALRARDLAPLLVTDSASVPATARMAANAMSIALGYTATSGGSSSISWSVVQDALLVDPSVLAADAEYTAERAVAANHLVRAPGQKYMSILATYASDARFGPSSTPVGAADSATPAFCAYVRALVDVNEHWQEDERALATGDAEGSDGESDETPSSAPVVSRRAVAELASMHRPPRAVHAVVKAACILLGMGFDDAKWPACQRALKSGDMCRRLRRRAGEALASHPSQIWVAPARACIAPLCATRATPVSSKSAAELFAWVRAVIKIAEATRLASLSHTRATVGAAAAAGMYHPATVTTDLVTCAFDAAADEDYEDDFEEEVEAEGANPEHESPDRRTYATVAAAGLTTTSAQQTAMATTTAVAVIATSTAAAGPSACDPPSPRAAVPVATTTTRTTDVAPVPAVPVAGWQEHAVAQLADMGFSDPDMALAALIVCNGNVNDAIDRLVEAQGM